MVQAMLQIKHIMDQTSLGRLRQYLHSLPNQADTRRSIILDIYGGVIDLTGRFVRAAQAVICRWWHRCRNLHLSKPAGAVCIATGGKRWHPPQLSSVEVRSRPSAAGFGLAGSLHLRPALRHSPSALLLSLSGPGLPLWHLMPTW